MDVRERGNFQHDVLSLFHLEQLQAEGKRWRDITPNGMPAPASPDIAAEQMEHFRDGLLQDSAETRFTADSLAGALQDFVEVIVTWMREQYDFELVQVRNSVSVVARIRHWAVGNQSAAPAAGSRCKAALTVWIYFVTPPAIPLWPWSRITSPVAAGSIRCSWPMASSCSCSPISARLATLEKSASNLRRRKITPVGAFYVILGVEFKCGCSRTEVLSDVVYKKQAYRHTGRFDAGVMRKFDHRPEAKKGDQFNFRLNKDGKLPSNSSESAGASGVHAPD